MTPVLDARFSAGYNGRPAALRDLELRIEPGEIVGLVGESGSGKSTAALAIMRLLEFRNGWTQGQIHLDGEDLLKHSERDMRSIRGRLVSLVMQSPMSALNPSMSIGAHFRECSRAHREYPGDPPDFFDLLQWVNLPAEGAFLDRHPRQLSVGQAQRVLIAMAVLHRPPLLIADEPTSALDAVNQASALRLFADLARKLDMSVLFISHDLLSVASLCHRIAILEDGAIAETGTVHQIFTSPQRACTQRLLAAIPRPAVLAPYLPGAALTVREDDKPSLTQVNYDDRLSPWNQGEIISHSLSQDFSPRRLLDRAVH